MCMIGICSPPQITIMLTHLCYHDGQKLKKNPIFFAFPSTKCRVETSNNREAVVVCASHVVKQPSKRSELIYIIVGCFSHPNI